MIPKRRVRPKMGVRESERVLTENEGMKRPDGTYILAAPDLARRLRERNARIAVLEKQLGGASAALIALAEGAELISDKLKIVQPFWAIYTKHGDAIEAARTRKGDHRG